VSLLKASFQCAPELKNHPACGWMVFLFCRGSGI
jgi:hypothetical protein